MATRTEVILIDDLDGKTVADETVRFSFDGVDYEIDLTAKNAAKLRSGLAPFVENGRRIKRQRKRRNGDK